MKNMAIGIGSHFPLLASVLVRFRCVSRFSEDWGALMYITGTVTFAAAVLLIVTVILNVITLIVYRGRTAK